MNNVLITGATGFIGKALAQYLLGKRHNIYYGTRSSIKAMSLTNGVWIPEDCFGVSSLLEEKKIEYVIHLGADSAIASKDKQQLIRNVAYTQNLMRACSGQHFIFASTVMIYPNGFSSMIDEPEDEYSLSKLLCEEIGEYYYRQGNLQSFHALRMCGVLGPGLKKGIVHKILTSENEVNLYGEEPGSVLGFLDIDDFCSLIDKILTYTPVGYGRMDVCPRDTISLGEIASLYGKKVIWTPGENRIVKGNTYVASSSYRWNPDYTTRQAIRRYYYNLKAS